jgi:holo-[acyl-carrier protein] synthase
MIAGLGTDLVETDRIALKISKEQGFRELVFSALEITYCESKTNKYEHYAARFAAKEAFLKAMGTGWTSGTAFNEIEIWNDERGKPGIELLGTTAETLLSKKISNISVSLTNLSSIAAAVVIIETE